MDIAVEIGGTFIDVVARDDVHEWVTKVPSVPGDLAPFRPAKIDSNTAIGENHGALGSTV
jgi:N-methylhydantoinase A/oxoprolinase/acetone carboxylase beta subunit